MSLPRVGFLGVGWIGRHRMEAMLATGAIEAVGVADPSAEMVDAAAAIAPGAARVDGLQALLQLNLDGVVIATPSALHAAQCLEALEAGVAVFCQKPLGRTSQEVAAVVEAARRRDLLLGVDYSYRHARGMQQVRDLVATGALGRVHAADLVFHNAYGPDKPWFYDPAQSGGGCVMDLGTHLVDLALWALDFPDVVAVESHLRAGGAPLLDPDHAVEDFALATLDCANGAVVRLACSWRLHAGREALIGADFHGTEGGASFRNVDGSFYDFTAERYRGTEREVLSAPPDAWGGRAGAAWARRLADGQGYDADADRLTDVARVIDHIYGRL